MIVATVLKSGGIYTPEWVHKLERQVARHLVLPHDFVCMTDMEVECDSIPLEKGLPGWWSKIELFRPGVFAGRVLYLDLDTLVVGNMHALATYAGPFAGLRDFLVPSRLQTAVMSWGPCAETHRIYDRFRPAVMQDRRMWSDQPYIEASIPEAVRLQDHVTGLYSLKAHSREAAPADAVLVCGHGNPRLSEREAGWAHTEWLAA